MKTSISEAISAATEPKRYPGSEQAGRLRALFILSVVAEVVIVISLFSVLAQVISNPDYRQHWQPYAILAAQAGAAAALGWAIVQSRRGKYTTTLALVVLGCALLSVPAVLHTDNGLPIGLAYIANAVWLASRCVTGRMANWVILVGLVWGGLLILAQLYPPPIQIVPPAGGRVAAILAVVIFLAMSWIVWSDFRKMSLSVKFVLVFIFIGLLGAGAVTLYAQNSTRRALSENVAQSLLNLADSHAQAVGDLLQQQIDAIRALSLNELLQNAVSTANDLYLGSLGDIQADVKEKDRQWIVAAQAGNLEDPLLRSRLTNPVALDLIEFNEAFPDHIELLLTDRYGGLVAANRLTSDYYQGDEEWWLRAYNGGEGNIYISPNPQYDESAGAYSLLIALPVYDRQTGSLLGVLRTTYRIDALFALLGGAHFGRSGEIDLYFSGEPVQRVHGEGLELASAEALQVMQDLQQQPYLETPYEGEDSLVSQSPVAPVRPNAAIQDLNWRAVTHQTIAEAYSPVDAQVRSLLLLTLGVVGLVALGAIFLAQVLAAPIQRLTTTALQVREGDLNARAQVEYQDEIGELASTFNDMTARLRQTIASLERTVAERTRELTLAGTVGRSLSEVRDPDALLRTAVELIRSNFDLYYTQIYLLDPSGRSLILRAGSGQVGEDLLRRGHRLPVGPGSINGRAASEHQAVIVEDTQKSLTFKANPALPDTRSEMAVPLMVGERVVGVLDMQSARPGALSETNLPAFQALAGQLAVAVQNADLFTQAQQARAEVERQAGRLARTGWQDYLNAVDRNEILGYVTDAQQSLQPLDAVSASAVAAQADLGMDAGEGLLSAPVEVLGEAIGLIQLQAEAGRTWGEGDEQLVAAVAAQVARQIDSLRLLDQAESYRAAAEEAARRLTRQGWQEYLQAASQELAFVYADGRVLPVGEDGSTPGLSEWMDARPLTDAGSVLPNRLSLALQAHGEPLGELSLESEAPLADADLEVVETIAARLGEHLDGLRLSAQTESALALTESLFSGSERVVRSASMQDVLQAVVQATPLQQFDRASVMIFDRPWEDRIPGTARLAASWERSGGAPPVPVGTVFPLAMLDFAHLTRRDQPTFVSDLSRDARIDPKSRAMLEQLGKSLAIFPLVAGEGYIGWLSVVSQQDVSLTEDQIRQVDSLVGQASAVIQGILLLEQSEARARREGILRQVAERVRGAVEPEQVLRAAAREVGAVLGRNVLVRLAGESQSVVGAQDDGSMPKKTDG